MTDRDAMAAAIAERWAVVQERIDRAAADAGRAPSSVRVVAVTKGFGVNVVRAARHAGLERFGESRVQEGEAKVISVPDVEWHLIGHLQSNKARRAVVMFPWLGAIDSVALLERIDALAVELGLHPRTLLQVNLTDSATQHGFALRELEPGGADHASLASAVAGMRVARVEGLMGIGPMTDRADVSRAAFARLRGLRDELEQVIGQSLPELSMGMSGDLESAVAEGATLLRVGTALFGARPVTE